MSNGSALCGLQKMIFGGLCESSDANNHGTQLFLLDIVRDMFEEVFVSIDALFKENVTLANRVLHMWARPGLSRSWSAFVVDLVTLENDVRSLWSHIDKILGIHSKIRNELSHTSHGEITVTLV